MDSDDIIEAVRLIQSAENVLILLGAGLSAPSGIPTFQEHWEGHRPRDLASLSFFNSCPVTSWRFYEERRQTALHAKPNAGHIAIAQFAKRKKHVLTITQNIDELSSRADHPPSGLVCLHGSLFDVKCSAEDCDYFTTNYSPECTVPGLKGKPIDPSGHGSQTEDIEIPPCPSCGHGLLRPGVVWFGDKLPPGSLERIDAWFDEVQRIDIVMVIGTEASVQPAASYVQRATEHGARVMYFNQNPLRPEQWEEMDEIDFFFQGDAAQSVPFLMRSD